jgi:predicted histone-like DNA-binding protein
MPVKYNIVERGNPTNPAAPKKFYPSIHSSGRVTTRELAERAAQMSTLTTVDTMAAIESFLTIIPGELAKGNIVELGDFGSLWPGATSQGVDTEEEVRADQITGVLPRFTPGKVFKRALETVKFNKN